MIDRTLKKSSFLICLSLVFPQKQNVQPTHNIIAKLELRIPASLNYARKECYMDIFVQAVNGHNCSCL